MIKVNDNTLFLTISVPDNANKISITNPALKNHVVVNDARITPGERAKLIGIEEGATADQTLTNTDNNIVLENGPDYQISLADSITLNNDLTAVDAFVDKVLIRDASSDQLPDNINAAHFYVDANGDTRLIAKSSTVNQNQIVGGDLKLKSGQDVDIIHGNSGQTTISDRQGIEKITLSGSGLTVKAGSHQFTFNTAGNLTIGAQSSYSMPVNASGASPGQGLKLANGGQLEFGDVVADLSTSQLSDLGDVELTIPFPPGGSSSILAYNPVTSKWGWLSNSFSQSPLPGFTNTTFAESNNLATIPGIGFDSGNSSLSINSNVSYGLSGINLFVDGGARIDGAIQVNDPSSTGYALPTADGTANQVLATDGSGAVTFVTPSTSNVTEGTNLYYTDARVAANSAVAANTAKTSFPGFGTTAGTALEGNTALFDGQYSSLTGVPSTFAPSAHTHTASEITDFDTEVSNNASVAANTAKVGYTDAAVDSRIAAASIDDLSDVDTSTVAPTDGQALVWDNANSKWEPGTVSGGGSSPWTTSGSDIYYTTGNVGVGTTTPAKVFHAAGDSQIDGTLLLKTQYNAVIIGSTTAGGGNTAQADSNVIIGHAAMASYTYSNGNSYRNVAVGRSALNSGTGAYNVAVGRDAMSGSQTRSNTIGIGNAAFQNGGGTSGVAIGGAAGRYATGNYNVLLGNSSGTGVSGTSTFANTVAVGYQALTALTTGAGNTAVGYQASDAMTVSAYTTALGYEALSSVNATDTAADGSTAVGYQALSSLTGATGNTAVGYKAGVSVTGVYNTILGHNVGQNFTTGTKTVIIGSNSTGNGLVGGTHNTVIGYNAKNGGSNSIEGLTAVGSGAGNTGSTQSTHIGYQAGVNNGGTFTTNLGAYAGGYGGKNNSVAIGAGANSNGGGNFSVAIGRNAIAGTDTVTVGYDAGSNSTDSVFIGYQAGNQETNNNRLYIENSNSTTPLIYGEFDNDIVRVNGTLQVNDPSSTGYAFPTATGTLGQVLEVDANGDLIFATPSGGGGGGSSQWTTVNTNEIYYNSGNVGIGNTDPDATLDVDGDVDIELDSSTSETFTIHDGTHDLFQVDTGTTGTIFSVNDVSGLPKLTVDDSDGVTIDKFKEVKYEKTSNTDFSYQGDVVYFGATTGMTQGDLYYFNSSGNWAQADADAVSSSGSVLLAIALGTASDTNGMLLKGTFTMAAGAIDGTEATGDELYVSTTAGHVTSDVSAYTTGDVVRVVGYCLDGTNGQIWFNPSNDWIELS